MTVEFVEVANGVLIFEREGRKLIKVSMARRDANDITTDCVFCGLMIAEDERGIFRDNNNRFVCIASDSSMHRP